MTNIATSAAATLALTLALLVTHAPAQTSPEPARAGAAPQTSAQAPATRKNCSERTVKGTYAFALTGQVRGAGPIAASGTTTFDGEGTFSITGRVNTATSEPILEGTFTGTYTVNEDDCTASAVVTTPGIFGYTELHFEGVIVEDGREIRYLITDPGIVFAGATVRQ